MPVSTDVLRRPARVRPGRGGGGRTRPPLRLVALAVAVALLALLPLFFVIAQAVAVGWSEAVRLLVRPHVGELLANTVKLVAVATAGCGVLGVGVAWCVERTALPGRLAWSVLLALPIAVPAFVNSYGWVSLTSSVQGFGGAVLIVTLSYFPLVSLPVAAALRGMDPGHEEAARSLGCGPWRVFVRVVLPQLRPALLGGMLIVALHLLAEFGAFAMLRFQTFTTAIYAEYQTSFNGPAASMLATALVGLCVILLILEVRVRGSASYARIGGGAARTAPRHRLGRWTVPVFGALAALVGLALGVPMGSLAYWLAHGSSAAFPAGALASAAVTTLGLGLLAALVTTALALPVGMLATRYGGRLANAVERSTYVAHALPGIVIALALVFVAITFVRPVYQTVALLVAAYAILFLPMALISVRAALAQAPAALTEAARALGQRPYAVLWRVTLPLIAPGLGAGAALVFLNVVTELTATLLLAPIGTHTLATQVWANTSSLSYAAAAPYAALIVVISAPATYVLTRRLGMIGAA
ncbi:MAG: ABC transporter permease [Streptosporangiaceae bacterium]